MPMVEAQPQSCAGETGSSVSSTTSRLVAAPGRSKARIFLDALAPASSGHLEAERAANQGLVLSRADAADVLPES